MRILLAFLLLVAPAAIAQDDAVRAPGPNVLFIAIDDMNDWVGCLGYPLATTPNLDRLAARGTLFRNAHCQVPACAPSRASLLLGRQPFNTGLYGDNPWQPHLPGAVTLPRAFREQGYRTIGTGKLFHSAPGFNDLEAWDAYHFWNPGARSNGWHESLVPDRSNEHGTQSARPLPERMPNLSFESPRIRKSFDWARLDDAASSAMPDARIADIACGILQRDFPQPAFLGVGLVTPHVPWYVPGEWFDRFPPEDVPLPEAPASDLEDLPEEVLEQFRTRFEEHAAIEESGRWREALQAYLAALAFTDAQLGRILEALESGPNAEDTVVVLWSDHGYHLGDKRLWHKRTLWEEATRVPLLIAGPGLPGGQVCDRPVGLIDLYPTLLDLCGLPPRKELDGRSLRPLLEDPEATWDHPVFTVIRRLQISVRTSGHRYTRHRSGGEELYDLRSDPRERVNLAARPESAELLARMRALLPQEWAKVAQHRGNFKLITDRTGFHWLRRSEEKIEDRRRRRQNRDDEDDD